MTIVLHIKRKVQRQADGSLLATSTAPPMLIVARDRADLEQRFQRFVERLQGQLDQLGHESALRFLDENGISYHEAADTDVFDDEVKIPLAV